MVGTGNREWANQRAAVAGEIDIGIAHLCYAAKKKVGNADLDGEFFSNLPAKGASGRLATLNLSARKLPQPCCRLANLAAACQYGIPANDHGSNNFQGPAHRQ